jgi:hypothetical protein
VACGIGNSLLPYAALARVVRHSLAGHEAWRKLQRSPAPVIVLNDAFWQLVTEDLKASYVPAVGKKKVGARGFYSNFDVV